MRHWTPRLAGILWITCLTMGCATVRPPEPPSLELPKPPADLRATRKGNKVTLTWTVPITTTDRQRVRSTGATEICRDLDLRAAESSSPSTQPDPARCDTRVGEAPALNPGPAAGPKVTNSFTDTLPTELQREHPVGWVNYTVEVLNSGGRGAALSNAVRIPLAEALAPPRDFQAEVTDKGVVLSWSGEPARADAMNGVRYFYRVFRRPEGARENIQVGQAATGGEARPSLLDSSFEWGKTYSYRIETVTAIAAGTGQSEVQVEGDDSPEIKVFADDVFPPAAPSGLQAAFSGPGQQPFIDLIWAPVTDLDLDGYNVYRREAGTAAVKLNVALLHTPSYRDAAVTGGSKYFYSVSSVDARKNESARSEEASEAVP